METHIDIDASESAGALEIDRHGISLGGINTLPLAERVVEGMRKLRPRLIRIFIQEFFAIYPERGRFDWARLDPYMEALARTGARVVAAITIKPGVLFPQIDPSCWRPTDVGEWQEVIGQLVRRYSVEQSIVTHWEIGNEPDIGENGGSPYLIQDPGDYAEYYGMTTRAILEAFPKARVGGPAMACMHSEPLPGLIEHCRQSKTQLDFLSWHLYHNDPGRHAYQVAIARLFAAGLPHRPELMVTEWSGGFGPVSVEERAFYARRAAATAGSILAMREAGLDRSFYYHLWDQICYPEDFTPFFSERGVTNMVRHWNEMPHRFGLFGVGGEVRPQYFVFQMLSRLGEEEIAIRCDDRDVRVLGSRGEGNVTVLAVNHSIEERHNRIATLRFVGLEPGVRRLVVYRIDSGRHWCAEEMELLPVENRMTYALSRFECQVMLPADSVTMVHLQDRPASI